MAIFSRKIRKITTKSMQNWPWRGFKKLAGKVFFCQEWLKKTGAWLKKTGDDSSENPSFFSDSLL